MTDCAVAILGPGVAGMLAALALAEAGASPSLLAPPQRLSPAPVSPVHRLPEALWQAPPPWLRGLAAALRGVGACAGERHAVEPGMHQRETLALLPDKPMLEAALRLLVRQHGQVRRLALKRIGVAAAKGQWQLNLADAPGPITATVLIDASGARRASLPILAAAGGKLPAQEVFEGRQTYFTLALRQAAGQPRRCWTICDAAGHAWLIDQMPDGLSTVTERVPSPPMDDDGEPAARLIDRLHFSLDHLSITPLQAWLRHADPQGPVSTYRAPPARRLVLETPPTGCGPAWLAVGDALVQTPPWLGQGVAQAHRHAGTLAEAWTASVSQGSLIDQACRKLDTLAARQLQAAALAAWAEEAEPLPV